MRQSNQFNFKHIYSALMASYSMSALLVDPSLLHDVSSFTNVPYQRRWGGPSPPTTYFPPISEYQQLDQQMYKAYQFPLYGHPAICLSLDVVSTLYLARFDDFTS